MSEKKKHELTLDDVERALDRAKRKGTEAAEMKYQEMCRKNRRRKGPLGLCGGAQIAIRLDGRTRLARLLHLASEHKTYFRFNGRDRNGTPIVNIHGMHHHQQQEIAAAASAAALAVLHEELNIVGRVNSYYT